MDSKDAYENLINEEARNLDPFEDGRFVDRIASELGRRVHDGDPQVLSRKDIKVILSTLRDSQTKEIRALLSKCQNMPLTRIYKNMCEMGVMAFQTVKRHAGADVLFENARIRLTEIKNGAAAAEIGAGTTWGLDWPQFEKGYLSNGHNLYVIEDKEKLQKYAIHDRAGIRNQRDVPISRQEAAQLYGLIDKIARLANPKFMETYLACARELADDPQFDKERFLAPRKRENSISM